MAWLLATLWTSPQSLLTAPKSLLTAPQSLLTAPQSLLTAPHTRLCSKVDVFGPSVRDPVPAAADGRAFQTPLQHVRQFSRLPRGVFRQNDRRGGAAWVACLDPLPRVGWRTSTFPLPDHGYAHVSYYSHRCFLGHQVRTFDNLDV